MTTPMIGNYGVNADDPESAQPQVAGVVVRELSNHLFELAREWRLCGAGCATRKCRFSKKLTPAVSLGI